MEQVLANINYFIREKLWCSIRRLADMVSSIYLSYLFLGDEKRSRPRPGFLEVLRYFPRGQCHWSHQRTHSHPRKEGSIVCNRHCTYILSWEMQTYWSRNHRYSNNYTWWEGADGFRQGSDNSSNFPMAYLIIQKSRLGSPEGHR